MNQVDSKIAQKNFEQILDTAIGGCHKIYDILVECIKARAQNLLDSKR